MTRRRGSNYAAKAASDVHRYAGFLYHGGSTALRLYVITTTCLYSLDIYFLHRYIYIFSSLSSLIFLYIWLLFYVCMYIATLFIITATKNIVLPLGGGWGGRKAALVSLQNVPLCLFHGNQSIIIHG